MPLCAKESYRIHAQQFANLLCVMPDHCAFVFTAAEERKISNKNKNKKNEKPAVRAKPAKSSSEKKESTSTSTKKKQTSSTSSASKTAASSDNANDKHSQCKSDNLTPSRLCKTTFNTTAPLYGVSLTSGQPVTIVQKFPDLLQQVVYEMCE